MYSPEATKLLAQLSEPEQTRVETVVNAVRAFSYQPQEQIKVLIGGNFKKGKLTHHITVAVGAPTDAAEPLFSHIVGYLELAGLPFDPKKSSLEIGQPTFLGPYSLSLSLNGKPLHIEINKGKVDPSEEALIKFL